MTRHLVHTSRCGRAITKRSECICVCQGAFHGLDIHPADAAMMASMGQRAMTEAMGGEVAEVIRKTRGAVLPKGAFCQHENVVAWVGYPHEGGVPDATGAKWWMTVPCDECHYEASWWKVVAHLERAARIRQEVRA